ncbi:hypothetical protein FH972_015295 [Carpinus fangiana]|uniref:Uncharacterized protein n=1 Tax=Carpinus fangiana TaxID=176857 RepID=A0A5N6RFR6_9ROSI|nr:hypothetical protein FH972_015295 [Carpinus fangiana]
MAVAFFFSSGVQHSSSRHLPTSTSINGPANKMSRMKKIISESDNDDEFYTRKLQKNEQSSSSTSIKSLVKEDIELVQCRCGLTTPIITSTITRSPRRRLYGCAMYDHKKVL